MSVSDVLTTTFLNRGPSRSDSDFQRTEHHALSTSSDVLNTRVSIRKPLESTIIYLYLVNLKIVTIGGFHRRNQARQLP